MIFKRIFPAIFGIISLASCLAQETIKKKDRLTDRVTEEFEVLKNNEQIKNGLYQAFFKRKTAVASGRFTNGKKTGLWYFYNPLGTLLQLYNYDKDSLRFEAREDTASSLRYLIDKEIAETDRVTKPVKAGGRYYGYLPYLGLYKTPFSPYIYGTEGYLASVELLVSPLGRLADFKVHLISYYYNYNQTTTMDINLFREEDKKFIPATFNGEPILSRIIIKCRLTNSGGLDFL